MKPKDKTDAILKEQFQILAEMETASNRKEIRQARKQLKHFIHKNERNQGKRQVRELLSGEEDN